MTKRTISIKEEELRIINVVKAVMGIKNVDEAVSFIVKDYGSSQSYSKFIKEKRGTRK